MSIDTLNRNMINSRSMVSRVSIDSCVDPKLMDSRPTVDPDIDRVSIECQPRCRLTVDRYSTADAFCTLDPTNFRSYHADLSKCAKFHKILTQNHENMGSQSNRRNVCNRSLYTKLLKLFTKNLFFLFE